MRTFNTIIRTIGRLAQALSMTKILRRSASIAAKEVTREEPQTTRQRYQHRLLPRCQRSNCDKSHFLGGTPQLEMPETSRLTTSSPSTTPAFRGSHVLTSSPIKTPFPCTRSRLGERSPSPHPVGSLLGPISSQRLSRNPNLSLVPSLTNLFPSTSAQPSHHTHTSHPPLVSLLFFRSALVDLPPTFKFAAADFSALQWSSLSRTAMFTTFFNDSHFRPCLNSNIMPGATAPHRICDYAPLDSLPIIILPAAASALIMGLTVARR